jgi:hypothetical protein
MDRRAGSGVDVLGFTAYHLGDGVRLILSAEDHLDTLSKVLQLGTDIGVHVLVENVVHVKDVRRRSTVLRGHERIGARVESKAIKDDTGCKSGCADLTRLEDNLTDFTFFPELLLAGFENGLLWRVGQERRKTDTLSPNL